MSEEHIENPPAEELSENGKRLLAILEHCLANGVTHLPGTELRRPIEPRRDAPLVVKATRGVGALFEPPKVIEGGYLCTTGCGAAISLPGMCTPCYEAWTRKRFDAELRWALESIPPHFAWAIPEHDDELVDGAEVKDLVERCPICSAEGVRGKEAGVACVDRHGNRNPTLAHRLRLKNARIKQWARIRGDLSRALALGRNVVFLGPASQVGKTSSAALLLRAILARGTWDALSPAERAEYIKPAVPVELTTKRNSAARPVASEPVLPGRVRLARDARFVLAKDIRRKVPAALSIAERSPLILLDDLGFELASAPAGSGLVSDRVETTREVIDHRHNHDLRMIITTWMHEEEMARFYGANIAKRVFERSYVIEVGPQPWKDRRGAA